MKSAQLWAWVGKETVQFNAKAIEQWTSHWEVTQEASFSCQVEIVPGQFILGQFSSKAGPIGLLLLLPLSHVLLRGAPWAAWYSQYLGQLVPISPNPLTVSGSGSQTSSRTLVGPSHTSLPLPLGSLYKEIKVQGKLMEKQRGRWKVRGHLEN